MIGDLLRRANTRPRAVLVFSVRFAGVTTAQAGVPVLPRRYVHILIEPRVPLFTIMKAIKGVNVQKRQQTPKPHGESVLAR
jgi:hypothetical protein